MSVMKHVMVCMCLALSLTVTSPVDGWRGIVPLRSTCKDVKRVLGVSACNFPDSTYYLKSETVHVTFATSTSPCSGEERSKQWNVPRGTVLEVEVFFKDPLPLSHFHLDESKFDKILSDFVDEITYNNDERGVSLTTINEEVRRISYFPAAKDGRLRCN